MPSSKSFSRSLKIVGREAKITGTMNIPSEKTLDEKTVQELTNLKLKEVLWYEGYCFTIGINLNIGESVKSGTRYDFTSSHTFDQSKKITKIVTTMFDDESGII